MSKIVDNVNVLFQFPTFFLHYPSRYRVVSCVSGGVSPQTEGLSLVEVKEQETQHSG